jgi:hypothetical protein
MLNQQKDHMYMCTGDDIQQVINQYEISRKNNNNTKNDFLKRHTTK